MSDSLTILETTLNLCRDGFHNGVYIYGRAGQGKTTGVENFLNKNEIPHEVLKGRTSNYELFQKMKENPNQNYVWDDCESQLADRGITQTLRSVLDGNRTVTYNVKGCQDKVTYNGFMVLITNEELPKTPAFDALKSRLASYRYELTNDEIFAMSMKLWGGGFRHYHKTMGVFVSLKPQACQEVIHFVADETERLNAPMNLRVVSNALKARLGAWKEWESLTLAAIAETAKARTTARRPKMEDRRRIAREIDAMALTGHEKIKLWKEKSGGMERASFFRYLQTA